MRTRAEIEREWDRVAAAVKSSTVARRSRQWSYAVGALRALTWALGIHDESPADQVVAMVVESEPVSHARLVR